MKKNLLFSIAFAALALAACNKQEPDGPGDGGVVEGQPSAMRITLSQNVGTYAASDANETATTSESTINLAKVYVFNAQNTLEAMVDMSSLGPSAPFAITSGSKKIFVAANFDPTSHAATSFVPTVGSTLVSDFEKVVLTGLSGTLNDPKNIAAADAMWMTTFKSDVADGGLFDAINVPTSATMENPHQETVNVGRLSAKVVLNLNTSNSGVLNAKIDETYTPKWMMMNNPVRSNLVGRYAGGILQTPLRTDNTSTNFWDTEEKNVDTYRDGWGGTDDTYSSFYVTENSRDKTSILYGNTTLARIAIKWTPTVLYDGGTDEVSTASYIPNADFYVIVDNEGNVLNGRLYIDQPVETVVQKHVNGGTVENNVKAYTDGIGYYFVPIRDLADTDLDRSFSVERNHLYRINVSKINSVGDPDGEPDPNTPIVTSSAMEVSITVSPWVAKDINTEI